MKKSQKILSNTFITCSCIMIAMIHVGYISHWVRGNTLITLLCFVGFVFNKLRAKTVEEVDDGYLNP